jgi:hypothetical protein
MTYTRLSQRTNQWMRPVNCWVSEEELERIKKVKGDVSISLWVRRQIRKALLEGSQITNSDPNQPAYSNDATTTSTTTPSANERDDEEVEVV